MYKTFDNFITNINYYYDNYNIYRLIIIIPDFIDINLFKYYIEYDNNFTSKIIHNNDNYDISNINDRIIIIKNTNINIKNILNQYNNYNLLLFYNLDYNEINNIKNFFSI